MSFTAIILEEAEKDIENAYIWYESLQINLGSAFFEKISEAIKNISNKPYQAQKIYKEVRRYIIKKFPFGVYYIANSESNEIQIIAILHFKRNSKILKKRNF